MAETAKNVPDVATSKPEALSAQRAVSTVSRWAQLALGSFATFSGLLYGMGYLLTLGQMRMLGAGTIDVSNQEIILRVINIPTLSLACAVALRTLEGLLVAVALVLVCLYQERLGLYRQEHVAYQKLRSLTLRWGGPLAALVIVSLFSSNLSKKILTQRDVLLSGRIVTIGETDKPSLVTRLLSTYPVEDIRKLKASEDLGRQVYGFQVWALVFCLTVLVGLWITLRHARELSDFRQNIARLTLGLASLLVLLQFLNIPFLYGYLVMETKFPAIETEKFPTKDVGNHLLLLGSKGGKQIVYSLEHRRMWHGLTDTDLLPAKQLPELDPFEFGNPFPSPEQMKSISGGLVGDAETETPMVPIPPEQWIDILSILLPAERHDEMAGTHIDDNDYSAEWDEVGTLDITTHDGQVFHLDLFEVHDRSGDKRDHYLAFKLSARQVEDSSNRSETEADENESYDEVLNFDGRNYYRNDRRKGNLTPGRYFHGRNPNRFEQFFGPKPNENAEKSADEAKEPGAEANKPAAKATTPAADATKPAADVKKPAADVKKPAADVKKPEADVKKPAADVKKPEADVKKPAVDAEKPDIEKPPHQAEKPAGKQNRQETTKTPDDAVRKQLDNIRLKTK